MVEQFLGAHPQVHAGGERTWVPELAEALAGAVGEAYPRAAARAAPGLVTDLAGRYLERLGALSPDASRITDKLPGNLVHLGLAALLMPGLRVIHCRRDPLDVCVSNYLQSFSGGHWYACDLGELGRTCREQERLMAHWRATLPVPIHEVRYEALVADPEQVVRETVAFCGLEWDDACLDHRGGARAVHARSPRRAPSRGSRAGRGHEGPRPPG